MSFVTTPRGAEVRTVRVHARRRLPARGPVTMLLANADLTPRNLPPSAIVVAKRLSIRAPREFALDRLRPPPASWLLELERDFAELTSRAARPRDGRIPRDASVIVFLDEAELLAAWARAILEGTTERWFWVTLFGAGPHPLESWVRAVEHRAPTAAAASIAELVHVEIASTLVRRLPDAALVRIVEVLAATNEWPEWAHHARRLRAAPPSTRTPRGHHVAPPWAAWIAEPDGLRPLEALVLGLSVGAHRSGSAVRTSVFTTRLARWVDAQLASDSPSVDPREGRSTRREPRVRAADPGAPTGRLAATGRDEVPTVPESSARTSPRATLDPNVSLDVLERDVESRALDDLSVSRPAASAGADTTDTAPGASSATEASAFEASARSEPSGPPRDEGTSTSRDLEVTPAEEASSFDLGFRTKIGGVFYLLNAVRDLAGLPVGAWAALELVARRLLVDPNAATTGIRDGIVWALDPLWATLAGLDGREPHEPIRSHDDAGPPLDVWAETRVDQVRDALVRVTRMEDPGALLVRPAEVFVTRTHIDVVEALENVSLTARLAGLDANPGWRSDLQRVITFHFV